jgi:magnesium-transporting ATPase (P-type)
MEHYIELWQQATIDESGMDRVYQTEDLVPMIIDLEKKQERVLRFKTLASVILLLAVLIVFLNRMPLTAISLLGIGIFTSSVLAVVILLNRLRFRITYEERSSSTLKLADISESRIQSERKIFTSYLPLFLIVALVGVNLMYVDVFREEETQARIFYHVILTASLSVAFVAALRVRIRRFHKQFLPVLDRIRRFKRASESLEP